MISNTILDVPIYDKGMARTEGDFRKYVELVRHKVTFHYDKRKIQTALSDRARRRGDAAQLVTVADDIRRFRCQVAADLVNTLVCHHVWGIAPGTDTQIEADRIADFGIQDLQDLP